GCRGGGGGPPPVPEEPGDRDPAGAAARGQPRDQRRDVRRDDDRCVEAPQEAGQTVTSFDYDVIVIGSGFGGSVSALRLTEKGYKVAVLEAGARFDEATYAKNSWDKSRFLFAPRLRWGRVPRD